MSGRILVIEDNAANLELVRYLLEAANYQVLVATDGEQGIAIAKREIPDLIVCDLQMPFLDGFGVLRELRRDALLAAIPVVAVTAFSMPSDRQEILTAGFNSYISKPIEPEHFVGQLEELLPQALRRRPGQ